MNQAQEPRNCVSCKERKVRCDRRRPCFNCTKAGRECVFPTTGRILRQPQRMRREPMVRSEKEIDLMDRIRRLENVVTTLRGGSQTEQDEDFTNSEMSVSDDMEQGEVMVSSSAIWRHHYTPSNDSPDVGVMVDKEQGRLYVGDGLWADIQQELDTIKNHINIPDSEDDDDDSVYTPNLQSNHRALSNSAGSFIFSNRSMSSARTEDLRPLPSQMLFIWQTYVENVDSSIKVLHVPTVSRMIHDSRGNFSLLPSFMEPLMFSIAFAAVNSLTRDEVQVHFRCDKKELVSRFRLGTEDSFSRADFINTKELSVVQALIIYTLLIRLEESQRYVWAITGLISRIAVAIGLHRDGSHFPDITPFEAEMRRRAWCYIYVLEFATGDFQVPGLSISDAVFDTRLPSNLDDDDMHQQMTALPEAKPGHTQTTLCLLRNRITKVSKHVKTVTASMYPCRQKPDVDTIHKLDDLSQYSQQEFAEFLVPVPPDQPICLLTRTMAAIAVRRHELILDHIRQPSLQARGNSLGRDKQFILALGVLEDIHMLQHGPSTRRWAWQFYGFVQWQPLVLVLCRLSVSEFDAMAEHAWNIVMKTLETCPESIKEEPLWQPLFNLIQCVNKRRLQQLKSRPSADIRKLRNPSNYAYTPRTQESEPGKSGGNTLPRMGSNDLPRSEQDHLPTAVSATSTPSVEWRSQNWFLTQGNNPDIVMGAMDAITSVYPREEDHLPTGLEQSAAGSQEQNVTEKSSDSVESSRLAQWNEIFNTSEQFVLWDQWAF
ncbi:uncharacterized protein FTOL_03808 [Fusarium torulosum]|uniref:Zn(2)-C6 fungal-type domain-containing protein n=1 Tax=Fusarium torulosum TaxID=33205 RepID=A0AAE8M5I7_9HYPO|nr:uncharacterized protein FTOL_03808 [Fusarium torulosum]